MIRFRSQRLLATASTLALVASLGATSNARAGQSINGAVPPATKPPVVNTGTDTFISVFNGAVVASDNAGNSISNTGTLSDIGNTIAVDASQLQGGIFNSGSATTGSNAIAIFGNSHVGGGISNTNKLDGGIAGIVVDSAVIDGGIHNIGTASSIGGFVAGIRLSGGALVSNGISNDGTIKAVQGNAILVQAATIGADKSGNSITNLGTIQSPGANIVIDANSRILGDVVNGGQLLTASAGISVRSGSSIDGKIVNSGGIGGGANVGIEINNAILRSGIQNTGSAARIDALLKGILITGSSTVSGGIFNDGTISAAGGGARAIEMDGGLLTGDITNSRTGVISAIGALAANPDGNFGIAILGGTFRGNILNDGLIESSGVGGGSVVLAGTMVGNVVNSSTGSITSSGGFGVGISISGSFNGMVSNAGSIFGNSSGIEVRSDGAITADIMNLSGGIMRGSNDTGLKIVDTNFSAKSSGILNQGSISSARGDAVFVGAISSLQDVTVTANIVNGAGGVIESAAHDGINIGNLSPGRLIFVGDVANAGTISGARAAIEIDANEYHGGLTNSGVLTGPVGILTHTSMTGGIENQSSGSILAGSGIVFNGSLGGDIANAGLIRTTAAGGVGMGFFGVTSAGIRNAGHLEAKGTDGVALLVGGLSADLRGVIENTGEIVADASGGTAIDLDRGIVRGGIRNTGASALIQGDANAIEISADTFAGGITNTGRILSNHTAINLSGAKGAVGITQDGGLIQGRNGADITIALNLDQTGAEFDDTFRATGGTLDGNVIGGGSDKFDVDTISSFAYLRGTASNLAELAIGGSGTVFLGASGEGANGEGVTFANTQHMSMGGTATAYLDDDTRIGVTDFTASEGGTLEYFLTANTGAHGRINASSLNLDGDIKAFIDPATFAGGQVTSLFYDNVLASTDRNGAFVQSTTSSIFFTSAASYDNTNGVDLTISRRSFADVLPDGTKNENAVSDALEAIYRRGEPGSDFRNLFAALFAPGVTPDAVASAYEALSGAEHAQLRRALLDVSSSFGGLVNERLDDGLTSGDVSGATMASLRERRYAEATSAVATDAGSMARGQRGWSLWLRGHGQWNDVDGDAEAAGYQRESKGLIGGADYAFNEHALAGAALSWSKSDVDFDRHGSQAKFDTWQGGLYGLYGFGNGYAKGTASYGWHDVTSRRGVEAPVPGAPFVATGKYNARAWSVAGELGSVWKAGGIALQPSVGLAYTSLHNDRFTETGAGGFSEIVGAGDTSSVASTIALRASTSFDIGDTTVTPKVRVGWRHEFRNERQHATVAFVEDPAVQLDLTSSRVGRDSLVASGGVNVAVGRNVEAFAEVGGQFNGESSTTVASVGLRMTW